MLACHAARLRTISGFGTRLCIAGLLRMIKALYFKSEELDGFVELPIAEFYRLAAHEIDSMPARALLRQDDGSFSMQDISVREEDFLLMPDLKETLANKYAPMLRKVCEKLGLQP